MIDIAIISKQTCMKLTKENTPEVWKAMLKFLRINRLVIDDDLCLLALEPSAAYYIYIDGTSLALDLDFAMPDEVYDLLCKRRFFILDRHTMGVDVDRFASNANLDICYLKTKILKMLAKYLCITGLTIAGHQYKLHSVDELMVLNDMEVA